jgi:LysM repeat protein
MAGPPKGVARAGSTTSAGAKGSRTPPPQSMNFYSLTGGTDLTVAMGDGQARLTGGDGGWQIAKRWGLAPWTYWDSPEPYRQAIPILFGGADGGAGMDSQEARIGQLYSLMRSPGSRVPPPVVMISGTAVQRADIQWVVESIEQGDTRRRAGDGDRYLAAMTVNLLQYTAGNVLVERSPSRRAASKGKQGTTGSRGRKTYTVKQGDTLPKIAARADVYGDAGKWKAIAHANGIRDPRSLKVGRVLKLPR